MIVDGREPGRPHVREVICVGSAKQDCLVRIGHQLSEDERVVTDRIVTAAGGNANTAAATVARMGVRVAICTTIGNDAAGNFVLAKMRECGVGTEYVSRRGDLETPQSINIANSDSNTRSIITVRALPFETAEAFSASPSWFHFDAEGFKASQRMINLKRLAGRVSVDAGISIGTDDLRGIDLYAPTREALIHTFGGPLGKAMLAAREAGAGDVVVTLGEGGAAFLEGDQVVRIPAHQVEVVSTLGAGDVFHGALVASLTREHSLASAVHTASVCAALSCRALDGQSAIPDMETLMSEVTRSRRVIEPNSREIFN
ncbi:carbohydrate kinase family protein [Aurantimonas sp. VKM B-3413]|uniref:carbohydrate kinase family protein n=1 Tax=Aurantimonas sp. VKM B-3413 TaxID=2779401 RepID=UPI002103932E|nr:PfkB family carbohydrate kinase [Aurantimonas sp. VKM B-3413]MCB8837006.1 PfkB family carbohydrate kinase [Aurantimonas sp. VKM B-3413]